MNTALTKTSRSTKRSALNSKLQTYCFVGSKAVFVNLVSQLGPNGYGLGGKTHTHKHTKKELTLFDSKYEKLTFIPPTTPHTSDLLGFRFRILDKWRSI